MGRLSEAKAVVSRAGQHPGGQGAFLASGTAEAQLPANRGL